MPAPEVDEETGDFIEAWQEGRNLGHQWYSSIYEYDFSYKKIRDDHNLQFGYWWENNWRQRWGDWHKIYFAEIDAKLDAEHIDDEQYAIRTEIDVGGDILTEWRLAKDLDAIMQTATYEQKQYFLLKCNHYGLKITDWEYKERRPEVLQFNHRWNCIDGAHHQSGRHVCYVEEFEPDTYAQEGCYTMDTKPVDTESTAGTPARVLQDEHTHGMFDPSYNGETVNPNSPYETDSEYGFDQGDVAAGVPETPPPWKSNSPHFCPPAKPCPPRPGQNYFHTLEPLMSLGIHEISVHGTSRKSPPPALPSYTTRLQPTPKSMANVMGLGKTKVKTVVTPSEKKTHVLTMQCFQEATLTDEEIAENRRIMSAHPELAVVQTKEYYEELARLTIQYAVDNKEEMEVQETIHNYEELFHKIRMSFPSSTGDTSLMKYQWVDATRTKSQRRKHRAEKVDARHSMSSSSRDHQVPPDDISQDVKMTVTPSFTEPISPTLDWNDEAMMEEESIRQKRFKVGSMAADLDAKIQRRDSRTVDQDTMAESPLRTFQEDSNHGMMMDLQQPPIQQKMFQEDGSHGMDNRDRDQRSRTPRCYPVPVCKFYLRQACKFGKNCANRHDLNEEQTRKAKEDLRKEREQAKEERRAVKSDLERFDGCLIDHCHVHLVNMTKVLEATIIGKSLWASWCENEVTGQIHYIKGVEYIDRDPAKFPSKNLMSFLELAKHQQDTPTTRMQIEELCAAEDKDAVAKELLGRFNEAVGEHGHTRPPTGGNLLQDIQNMVPRPEWVKALEEAYKSGKRVKTEDHGLLHTVERQDMTLSFISEELKQLDDIEAQQKGVVTPPSSGDWKVWRRQSGV